MKLIFIILFSLSSSSCYEYQDEKEQIEKFVDNIIIQEKSNLNEIEEYVNLNLVKKSQKDKEFLKEVLKKQTKILRGHIKENNDKYIILSHKEFEKKYYEVNLIYSDYSKVYYIVCNELPIAPIIIEDGKIVSFFYGLTKHKRNSYPWILNKNETL